MMNGRAPAILILSEMLGMAAGPLAYLRRSAPAARAGEPTFLPRPGIGLMSQ